MVITQVPVVDAVGGSWDLVSKVIGTLIGGLKYLQSKRPNALRGFRVKGLGKFRVKGLGGCRMPPVSNVADFYG